MKKSISIRLNPKVLEWFKNQKHSRYQTHINQVLESYVEEQLAKRQRSLGRAQEVYKKYYSQCFWHYRKDLEITSENLCLVLEGLKKFGGREGLLLAEELSN